jgi:hypothetical protein
MPDRGAILESKVFILLIHNGQPDERMTGKVIMSDF